MGWVDPGYLTHHEADVWILMQDASHRVDDVFGFQFGSCHLVEQGQEGVVIIPIQHQYIHGCTCKCPWQPTTRQNLLQRSPPLDGFLTAMLSSSFQLLFEIGTQRDGVVAFQFLGAEEQGDISFTGGFQQRAARLQACHPARRSSVD